MKRTAKSLTFALILAASLGVAAVVWAYWTVSGSGSAPGEVANLDTPTFVSVVANGADVTIDWTDVAAPGGGAVDGYYIQRYAGSTPSAACASSPSALLSASNCVDAGVANGTYTYKVTVVFDSFKQQSAASNSVTVTAVVGVPPTGAITFPGNGAALNAASFNAGCTPTGICGTAADPQGVQSVSVSIQQGTGNYWNGTAFASATEVFQPTTLASPGATSTNWAYSFALPADGPYTVRLQASDANGNSHAAGVYAATSGFTVDTAAPTAGALSVNGAAASLAGSSTFNKTGAFPIDSRTDYTDSGSGLASSTLTRAAGTLSNNACSAYGAGTTLVGTPAQSGLTTGCYLFTLTGTDNAGNTEAITTTVKVDTVAPNGGLITANNGNVFNTSGSVALNVTSFVDAHSGISSNTITRSTGSLAANACGALSGSTVVTVSGGNDSATLTTGCYQYTLTGVDSAGNSATATSGIIKVDRTAPSTPTLSFSGMNKAYFDGASTVYFAGAAGGYTVTASSTDADTLVSSYGFGSLAANGFTGTQTGGQNVYTFTSAATSTTATVTAVNNAGATSSAASYTLTRDAAGPTGGAVTANGGATFNTTGTVALSVTNFTDAGSGVASTTLTRATGALTNNSCATLSGATAVTVSGGNDSATLTTGCYQYTLTATDNVGNVSSATSSVVKVDTGQPGTTVNYPQDRYSYAISTWASGCTSAGGAGICGSTGDGATNVASVEISLQKGALWWNGTAFASATEVFLNAPITGTTGGGAIALWRYPITQTQMGGSVGGIYNLRVRGTDNAGNVSTGTAIATSKFRLATRAFAITSATTSGNKASFAGTAQDVTATVSVKVCSVAGSGSPAPDFSTCEAADTVTSALPNASTGAWSAGPTVTLVNKGWYYAQATQVDTTNNVTWQFVTTSPFQA